MTGDRIAPRTPEEMRAAFVEDEGLSTSDIRRLTRRCEVALTGLHAPKQRQTSQWAYVDELSSGARRLDGWAINRFTHERRAYEIKVTRSDFLAELNDPEKRTPAFSISNRYYFVAPADLIQPDELPDDCGLIEVHFAKTLLNDWTKEKVEGSWFDSEVPLDLVFELARRAA